MSNPIASYAFLSWARQGLGIHTQDAKAGELRGTIPVGVTIRGKKIAGSGDATESFSRDVALYGPGDVIGIDHRAVVRTEPRHWITNFEPNYMAFVEFYDEDFLWRYTPAAPSPDKKRLIPWMTLVVLEEGEFKEGGNVLNRPLPFIQVAGAAAKFPPPAQLWAWAHVHVNGTLAGLDINDTGVLAQRLDQTVRADRDQAYARLLSPRTLKANSGYHAFVIPSFETGRLAGLGLDPASAPSATRIAWEGGGQEPELFPIYHRWYFRTGSVGDFEYLVRLLKPKTANPKVGTRDMDVQDAGAGLGGIADPELGGILRLGGALKVPFETLPPADKGEFNKYDLWADPFPHPFQEKLADFVNLPTEYAESGTSTDPVIAPPIYGRWHAAITRLLDGPVDPVDDREKWLNELNLDPRYRVAAGFGTSVVQKNQEDYMEAAWLQVGRVLAGNQKIRYAMMALAATKIWNARHLEPAKTAQPEHYLMMAAPVHRRVIAEGLTVQHRVLESTIPPAAMSKVMRQAIRPRGRIARTIGFDATRTAGNLLGRINAGEVKPAPPKTVPPALPTDEKVAGALQPSGWPRALLDALRRHPWLRWMPLLLAILLALLLLAVPPMGWLGLILVAGGIWFAIRAKKILEQTRAVDTLRPGNVTPESIDAFPLSPDFKIATPGTAPAPTFGTTDSDEGRRFKDALRSAARLDLAEASIPIPVRSPLALSNIVATVSESLRPEQTIPVWTMLHVAVPGRIRDKMVEDFGEVMVYPEIDLPMYEPLKKISAELFLPNIHLIEQNTITLLETNQKFIEAYMVGLNHEFSRELLWREYPTDQRGSYFRQFWDVRSFLAEPGIDKDALRERLRDIPEVHTWSKNDDLGDHDHREAQGDKEEELVLVIRGELLKKYPNAIVYAHRADWERVGDTPAGAIDKARPRKLRDLTPAEEAKPPRDVVKTPLYEASVEPDIYFFGFDITARTAKGGFIPQGKTEEDPGWFFVIKERPGEPRFGLDIPKPTPQANLKVWNELAWSDVMVPFAEGASLTIGARQVTLTDPGGTAPIKKQHDEDKRFRWQTNTHSAELAYILYQVPVLMAVHAAEMLPKDP